MKTLLIALGLIAVPVFAQTPAQPAGSASAGATAPRPASQRDVAASRALFDRLDRNRDGYLAGDEMTGPEARRANWLAVDRDGDGRIGRDEFSAIPAAQSASGGATRRE